MIRKSSGLKKFFKMNGRHLSVLILVFAATSALYLSGVSITVTKKVKTVSAATSNNLYGYGWSGNIGWISFSCTNNNSCGVSDYGVNVQPANGNFSGYAWNNNIGWISFNETTGCPEAGCTTRARLDKMTGAVTGWAKAVNSTSGWNGWIKLAGNITSGGTYGATLLPSNSFSGYSWGGDVVGWISWSCSNGSVCSSSNYAVLTSDSTLVNRAPVAVMASPASSTISTYTNQEVLFDATGSYDPDQGGSITAYEWRENGCSSGGGVLSSNITFSKTFSSAGAYVVYLRVQDNSNTWSTNCPSVTINVSVPPPLDGACGPANGVSTAVKPETGLCDIGTPSAVTGTGPWFWTCSGQFGGNPASCSAPNSCGNAICEPGKRENPNTCRSDCAVNVREF